MKKTWMLLIAISALVAFGFTGQKAFAQVAVSGIVLNSAGDPIEGAVVVIHSADRVRGQEPFHQEFTTEANGVFGWRQVPAGNYIVQASARGIGGVRENVVVRGEAVRIRLVIQERQREQVQFGSVGGQVVNAAGEPLANAVVTITVRQNDRRGIRERGIRVRTNERGVFLFERVPAGNASIMAVARGYNQSVQRIVVIADDGIRANFELTPRERDRRGG